MYRASLRTTRETDWCMDVYWCDVYKYSLGTIRETVMSVGKV